MMTSIELYKIANPALLNLLRLGVMRSERAIIVAMLKILKMFRLYSNQCYGILVANIYPIERGATDRRTLSEAIIDKSPS
jgi:hypothetical protein